MSRLWQCNPSSILQSRAGSFSEGSPGPWRRASVVTPSSALRPLPFRHLLLAAPGGLIYALPAAEWGMLCHGLGGKSDLPYQSATDYADRTYLSPRYYATAPSFRQTCSPRF